MDRIINFFPEVRHAQLVSDLALNMHGIISQRLVKTVDGKRAAVIEILLGTPRAADLIAKGDVSSLKELMEKSDEQGMQTFDIALYKLYKEGRISMEEAIRNADSKNNQEGNQEVCLSFLWRRTTRQSFRVRELGNQQLVKAGNNGQRIG